MAKKSKTVKAWGILGKKGQLLPVTAGTLRWMRHLYPERSGFQIVRVTITVKP